jgi:hypothetical protein
MEGIASKAIDGIKDDKCNWAWGSTNSISHTNNDVKAWWKILMTA